MNYITRWKAACKGNTRIKINPQFQELSSYIENLPKTFDKEGETIYSGRNQIKVQEVNGLRLNVKRFSIPPYFFNRIIYVLFRETKAERSYNFALKLSSMEIDSPTPIGYYLHKNGVLLSHCYLITLQEEDVYTLRDIDKVKESVSCETILAEFGRYTATLHQKGIFHYDYSLGNILFRIVDGKPKFTLVDINRMVFHKPTYESCCRNFQRLAMTPEQFSTIVEKYATAMGYERESTYLKIISYHTQKSLRLKQRRKLKASFKGNR